MRNFTLMKNILIVTLVLATVFFTQAQTTQHNITTLNSGFRFTENKGQIAQTDGSAAKDILYVGDAGAGAKIYFQKNKISYVLSKTDGDSLDKKGSPGKREANGLNPNAKTTLQRVDVEFVNSNPNAIISGEGQTKDFNRYYLPQCKDGLTANSFLKIIYKEIYPNIDIVFFGRNKQSMEYDIILRPGANADDIKLKYSGADDIQLDKDILILKTSIGEIKEFIPEMYQNINGQKTKIKGAYSLDKPNTYKNASSQEAIVQFKPGKYDHTQALVIDPWVEIYGGSDNDYGYGIKTDNSGNVVVAGYTSSTDFPTTIGLYKGTFLDACIVKLDPAGNRLWALYYGGSDNEVAFGLDVDTQDNIIVVGITFSRDFPVSAGAYQNGTQTNNQINPATSGSYADAFVAKFTPAGIRHFSTYYGREFEDIFLSVTTDNLNNIFISGASSSLNFSTPGHFQDSLKILPGVTLYPYDAVIVKFNANGTPAWATYYGGSADDQGHGIEVDAQSNIIITGYTKSTDFPVSAGAIQPANSGGTSDAFIVKMDSTGKTRLFGTYYGGSTQDIGNSVAVDNANNILFAGSTTSPDFPVSNAYQASFAGLGSNTSSGDAFLVKLTSAGTVVWGTYLGGIDDEDGRGIVTDAVNNNIYLAGHTYSNNFPVTSCAYKKFLGDGGNDGSADSFVSSFDSNGKIICSGYLGVDGINELTYGYSTLAMNGGNLYLLGITNIYGTFPYTINTNQVATFFSLFSPDDIFVGQVCLTSCGFKYSSDKLGFIVSEDTICMGTTITYSLTSVCNVNSYNWEFTGGTPSTSAVVNPTVTYNTPGTYDVKLFLNTTCGNDSVIKTKYITVYPLLTVTVTPDTAICLPHTPSLNAIIKGSDGIYTQNWLPGNLTTTAITPAPTVNTTYTVTVSNKYCPSVTDSVSVTVYSAPTASFVYSPASPSVLDAVEFTDQSKGKIKDWQWDYGDNTGSVLQDAPHSYPLDTGTYSIRLIVTDSNNCTDSSKQKIFLTADYVFYSPNSFTPNGDGLNDVFKVESSLIVSSEYKMSIYDRWGQSVFESAKINEGWDGKLKGTSEIAGDGVYVWKITTKAYLGKAEHTNFGYITLIR